MIPSGYKEDVVYSQIPTNGNGDLSFTRASNGTRVNSAGLVEVVPWNLCEYSEELNIWTTSRASVTTNATTAPNGTTTADKVITDSTANTTHQIYIGPFTTPNLPFVISVYAKKSEYDYIHLGKDTSTTKTWFDLTNGTVGTQGSDVLSASIESVGNGWYRCINVINNTSTSSYVELGPASQDGTRVISGTPSGGIFAWGAQLNIGSTAKPYFPTTDRLNVPRLTYQNGGGGCPSLLLEKQSTNEALESNTLTTNPNVVDFSTTTANVYVSPDGTQNAMRFTETTNNNRHGFYQYTTVTAQTYTASIFTKQTGRRYISFDSDITGTSATSFFDLQTISVVSSGSGHTCSIQDFGNGWLRLIVTFTASAGARYVIWGGSPNGTTNSYAGSTSISQTFYGYQLEASSYPTSYIPTTSASATRVADACYKTGISSLIGQSAGTLFLYADIQKHNEVDFYISISDASNLGEAVYMYQPSSGTLDFLVRNAGNTVALSVLNANWTAGLNKVAIAYTATTIEVFINGVSKGSTTFTALPTLSQLTIGSRPDSVGSLVGTGIYSEVVVFPTRLSNSECISLTTI
jgi:hypothetical protein